MQHAVTLQCVIRLVHARLSDSQHVSCRCVVHISDKLSSAHSLAFVYQHTAYHTHTGETHCRTFTFFHDAHIRLVTVLIGGFHCLCLDARWNFLLRAFVATTAATCYSQCQQPHSHFYIHILSKILIDIFCVAKFDKNNDNIMSYLVLKIILMDKKVPNRT